MQTYEYKVVPAPNRSKRVKGVKGTAGRFAALLTETMNDQAKEGWQYLRSDSLPVEEKPGMFKSKIENYHTMLVFRRPVGGGEETVMAGYIEDKTDQAAPEAASATPPASSPVPSSETAPVEHTIEPVKSGDWEGQNYRQDPPLRAPTDGGSDSPFAEPHDDDPFHNR